MIDPISLRGNRDLMSLSQMSTDKQRNRDTDRPGTRSDPTSGASPKKDM